MLLQYFVKAETLEKSNITVGFYHAILHQMHLIASLKLTCRL